MSGSVVKKELRTTRTSAAPAKPSQTVAGVALVVAVLVVYWPVYRASYIIDDDINITANPTLLNVAGLKRIWFEPGAVQQYYPVVYTTYWMEYRLWGSAPLGYHLVNVLLHAVNVLLLWQVLLRLQVPGAWLAAALFALHPVEVETVAWVSERKNVLSLTLALAALVCYLRFAPADDERASSTRGAWRWYALALVLFVAALLSKTVVVTLPAVLVVIYWWRRGRFLARDIVPLLPMFALSLLLGLAGMWLERNHVGAVGDEWSLTFAERFLVAGRGLWFQLGKLFWPAPLVFFYPRWTVDASQWWQWLWPIAALLAPIGLWLMRNKIGRGSLAAYLIYVGVLLPALGFINVYFHLFSYVADHFQYHASPAIFAWVAAAMTLLASRGTTHSAGSADIATSAVVPAGGRGLWWASGTAAVLLLLAGLTMRAAALYRDEETLFRDTIAKNPTSWIAWSNLGLALGAQGRHDEALEMLARALELDAGKSRVHYNYAKLLLDRGETRGFSPGDLEQAIQHFGEAGRLEEHWAAPHVGLGAARLRQQQFAAARDSLQDALAREPENVDALYTLGLLCIEEKEFSQAEQFLTHAVRLDPGRVAARLALGRVLAERGEMAKAAEEFAAAVALRQDDVAAWTELAVTRMKLGQVDSAVECFREIARLQPNSLDAQNNLRAVLEYQRQHAAGVPPTAAGPGK